MDSQLLLLNKTNALIKPPQFSFFASSKSRYNPSSTFSLGCKLKRAMCAMKSYRLSELSNAEVESLKARPRIDFSSIFGTVNPIVDDVRQRGDDAVKDYTAKFDKVKLDKIVENVSELPDPELEAAVREAFDVAYDNIYAFHLAQRSDEKSIENMKGVRCKRVARSIGSVGLYVPGGTAVLPSTALMLAIPAQIAGCKTVVLATPPSQDGSICKEVLYCAKKAGVTHILKAGGAQAISAMAWGTDSCPKVEKIFGPGNQYVTAAKMILQNSEAMISIDMPAGPSEVLVIADRYASPVHIAADLLSQAEHGPDSQVVLVVAGDGVDMKTIEEEISKQCQSLPRGEYASKALSHSFTVFARDMVEVSLLFDCFCLDICNVNPEVALCYWELVLEFLCLRNLTCAFESKKMKNEYGVANFADYEHGKCFNNLLYLELVPARCFSATFILFLLLKSIHLTIC
ncbi:HISTIDINOL DEHYDROGENASE HDH [Salix viminalis]|uniref:HISTIDINOL DEHYDROGENASE HDH n=1 Tax=Salix viminalis TaxID=40686 RepID=A0A9Q0U623_SALVM|nr:HISTIDINOL DEHYDROGENASE HDH [Salix viminalis]KAJ6724103.1 HISTIDINOL DEHYDROGENASE HDH [Salix viminalis]KAJ6724104.1 HISTIDINOL DEHYDROGENASE HDH [Salix viminalis]KAJ6724105.1 HISTIDINOL DEHYDROGENASE HDH [Salix viminalis]